MTALTKNCKRYDYRKDPNLNELQKAHIRGEINLYEPVETYTEQWTKGTKYDPVTKTVGLDPAPIPGTRKATTLPPIYIQWKDDWRKRGQHK